MSEISDYQFIQRGDDGLGRWRVQVPSGSRASTFSFQVEGAAETAWSVAESDGDFLLTLPTGGPYSITVHSQEHPPIKAEHVLVGDLWVLAGQSNMQGLGAKIDGLQPIEKSNFLSLDRTWKPSLEPLHRFWETKESAQYKMSPYLGFEMSREELDRMYEEMHPQDEIEPVGGVGPAYFFAQELIVICGVPIGLIPCALGGSSLDMCMRSFGEEHDEEFADTLFGDLVGRVALVGGRVAGVLWYQGESDTVPELAKTYLERFEEFVGDLREVLGDPDLPFITVQLASAENHEWVGEENWTAVREAQRLASEHIPRVEMVAVADLPRDDDVHISTPGHRVLGVRLARAASSYTDGCDGRFSIPRLKGITSTPRGVEVQFSRVNGSIQITDDRRLAGCFTIPGYSIVDATITSRDSVMLRLSKPIGPEQEIFYGSGFSPRLGLVDEAGFAMPLFGPVTMPTPT